MSTINTSTASNDMITLLHSGDATALLSHAQELSQSAITANEALQKVQQSTASIQFTGDAPSVPTSYTPTAPTLSPPKINASSMMLMLMTLQTEANNEAVSGGIETCESQQTKVAQENENRANDMVGYYETMRRQEDVNGGMNIGNVIISSILLVTAAVATVAAAGFTIATGGGGVLALTASIAGLVAAASSFTSSIINLPQVQEQLSEKGALAANIILSIITVTASIIAAITGMRAASAVKNSVDLMRKGCQAIMNGMQIVEATTTATSATMSIATSSINYKASNAQYNLEQHNINLEKLQADFDTAMGNLEIIMDSYAAMVDSTSKMLENTMQGAKSAATLSA